MKRTTALIFFLFALTAVAQDNSARTTVSNQGTLPQKASLCDLQRTAKQGEHQKVQVGGIYIVGFEGSILTDPSCPNDSTWVELDLKSNRQKKLLTSILDTAEKAEVVFDGEFYGPGIPDPNLPDAIRKIYHPGWGHLGAFKTKLIVEAIKTVQPLPPAQMPHVSKKIGMYWIDPSTGLMWTAKDNGKNISWKGAMKYCHNLRLAGYSDWKLPTLVELKEIYDSRANAPGLAGQSKKPRAFTWHVKGNLFLSGNQWSSSQEFDDRGHPSGYAWRFDFNEGRSFGGDETSFYTNKRALCVRQSIK